MTNSTRTLSITLILSGAIIFLVASRYLWSENPDFLFNEVRGVQFDMNLENLCDPNPFAGLQGPLSLPSSRLSTSPWYAIPTKFLRGEVSVFTIHRALTVGFYSLTLVLLCTIAWRVRLAWPFAVFLLVYYGLSEQLLMPFFMQQLTVSAIAWFFAALFVFLAMDDARRSQRASVLVWVFVVPLLTAISYQTYAVVRPVGIVYWFFTVAWIALAGCTRRRRLELAGAFVLSNVLGYFLLTSAHPGIRFDFSILSTLESVVEPRIAPTMEVLLTNMWDRFLELQLLFYWPDHSYLSTWYPPRKTTGWLEIWGALGILAVVLKLLSKSTERRKKLIDFWVTRKWIFVLLIILSAASVMTALGAVTGVRGHRMLGFYIGTTVLTAWLAHIASEVGPRVLKYTLVSVALLAALATVTHRAPLISAWHPPADSPAMKLLIDDLTQMHLAKVSADLRGQLSLVTCTDLLPFEEGEKFNAFQAWSTALYVSDYYCRLKPKPHFKLFPIEDCACDKSAADNRESICLLASYREGDGWTLTVK